MAENLSCEIVRDLLPLYADGLTSEVTKEAVKEHLLHCSSCAAALDCITQPEPKPEKEFHRVDYLKKVRSRFRVRSVIFGAAAVLIVLCALCVKAVYFDGKKVSTNMYNGEVPYKYTVNVSGSVVDFSGYFSADKLKFARAIFEEDGDEVRISVYTSPGNLFNRSSFQKQYTATKKISAVYVEGYIAWENGVKIDPSAARVYAKKTPYIGDITRDEEVASALGISDRFGAFTNELKTSAKPYGWTLQFETAIDKETEAAAKKTMLADSCVILAVIDNLDQISWEYTCNGTQCSYTVTAAEASSVAGKDIKKCAASASEIQELMQSLNVKEKSI